MAAKLALLDDDGSDGDAAPPTLRINEAYARRLEHNKKREDLHRLQELKKRGLVESDSESDGDEDEDGILPEKTEVRILDTLARIKNKDPSIYQPEVKFFNEEEDDEEQGKMAIEKKKKPVYLKDVVAKQALEGSDDEEEDAAPAPAIKTYAQEQQDLKDELLQGIAAASVDDDDEDETLFKVRKKNKEEIEKEEELADRLKREAPITKKLEECFGKDDTLDENDRFLKDYLQNQGWIDKNKDKLPSYDDVVGEVSDEEAELEEQDEYEAVYNFRFEEGGDAQVLGHSRVMEDSVRKISEKRKERRRKKLERIAQAEVARQEEVKRLKSVKRKETAERMIKIQSVAGIKPGIGKIDEDDLEDDFDPDQHDKKMQQIFGEEYYEEEDPDFHSGDEDAAADFELGDGDGDLEMEVEMDGIRTGDDEDDETGDGAARFRYAQVKPNRFGLSAAQILEAEDKELNQYVSLKAVAPYRTEEWIPRGKYHRLVKKEKKMAAEGSDGDDQEPIETKKMKQKKKRGDPGAVNAGQREENRSADADPGKKKRNRESTGEVSGSVKLTGGLSELTKSKKPKKKIGVEVLGQSGQSGKKPVKVDRDSKMDVDAAPGSSAAAEGGDGGGKKKRRRRKQGLNMSRSRLISYGKIDLPKKHKS